MNAISEKFQKEPAIIISAIAAIVQALALDGSGKFTAVLTILAGLFTRQNVYAPANVEVPDGNA